MHALYKPAERVVAFVVQAEPTSSAVLVVQRAAAAAVQEWHPLGPADPSDTVCKTASRESGWPVCRWGEVPAAMTACEVHHSCTTCRTAAMHPTSNRHHYDNF